MNERAALRNMLSAAGGDGPRRWLRGIIGAVSAVLLVLMLAVTTVDVIGRYFFNAPILGAFEVSEVAMALLIYAGLPLVCMDRGNVSVTLLTERLGPGLRRIQATVVSLVGAGVLGVLAWRLARQAMRLSSYGDTTMFLSIPLGPVAWGMAVLTGVAALLMLANALAIARGRMDPDEG
ncbi:TRAP transporter small permease [Arhodomonas sp. SL1]|uniref:TRAP transporter small permease n=1 Tax=Arhodomonas sp. SL1 TaxID=3425691 RepID=UPI003F883601